MMFLCILFCLFAGADGNQPYSAPGLSNEDKVIAVAMNPDPDKYPTMYCRLHSRQIAFITVVFPGIPGSRVDACTYEPTDPKNPYKFISVRLPGDNQLQLRHRSTQYPQLFVVTTFTAEPGAVNTKISLELDPTWTGEASDLPENYLMWPNLCWSLIQSPNFTPGGVPNAPDIPTKKRYYDWIERSFIFTEDGRTFLDNTRRVRTPEVPEDDIRNSPPLYAWSQHYIGIWDEPTTPPFPHNTCLDGYVIPLIGAVSNDGDYLIALGGDPTQYIAQAWGVCYHHIQEWVPKDVPLVERSMRMKLYGMRNDPDALLERMKKDFPEAAKRMEEIVSKSE
jgi:hypothetical protein